ncbi:MAG: UbiA family prenyltransferase [Nocardioidaceae bacterium]|nr:UbiA family prenyltransferase [Nocardioidaceae bacterium]
MTSPSAALVLLRASHPGPTVAVTVLAGLLCLGTGAGAGTAALVVVAVLTGQLTIGWSNDLVDAERDRAVGRSDKPLASGSLSEERVRTAVRVALLLCVVTSLALGLVAGLVHLVLLVGSGWAYNLGLKRTAWSWGPYALAFGSLPVVVALATGRDPQAWEAAAGALLGVGAHVLNVLPDLEDDAATGVSGWPHRMGGRRSRVVAPVLLAAASVVAVLGPAGSPSTAAWAVLAAVLVAAVVGARGSGRVPFGVAVAIALVDVVLLVSSRGPA